MSTQKASQTTTRRDIPSARKLPEARPSAPEPRDRPSGICRTTPANPDAAIPHEDEDEATAGPSR